MYRIIKKIWNERGVFRSILKTLYFNFHYFPLKTALKLPVFLYKPNFECLRGTVKITGEVKTGMIRLGFNRANVYPHSGITYENRGGTIIFCGHANIGNNSFISIGSGGVLQFGENFLCNASLKCVCWHKIEIGKNTRVGWEVLIMDTSFHRLKCEDGFFGKGSAPIVLGAHNWISTKSVVFPGAKTADWTVVAACSLLNREFQQERILLGGIPAKLIKQGVWRDINDDIIDLR